MPIVQALAADLRSSSCPDMMDMIRVLMAIAAEHQFDFRVDHIDGVANITADALSRFDSVTLAQLRVTHPSLSLSPTLSPVLPSFPRRRIPSSVPPSPLRL